jgi:hypothetical protein
MPATLSHVESLDRANAPIRLSIGRALVRGTRRLPESDLPLRWAGWQLLDEGDTPR